MAYGISSLDPALKRVFEPHSPGTRRRLQAMERLSQAGILVGAALMPVLPLRWLREEKTVGDNSKEVGL